MNILEATALGLVQGATEFLPVSSSGHLVLIPYFLKLSQPTVFFDVVLHLGTLTALLIYFRNDLIKILASFLPNSEHLDRGASRKLLGWLLLATIPAVLLGFFFKDFLESWFSNPRAVSIFLVVTGIVLYTGEKIGMKRKDLTSIDWKDSILIGLAQAFAIIPGISRSGATISAGLIRDLNREDSARFSFLLAIPITAGAGFVKFVDASKTLSGQSLVLLAAGFLTALITGWLAIRFFLRFVRENKLSYFAWYCLILGTMSFALTFLRKG